MTFRPDQYLLEHGWQMLQSHNPWRWWLRGRPGIYYRLDHAVKIQKSMEKERVTK